MSEDTTHISGAAERYATALFDLAQEQKSLEQTEKDLDVLMQCLETSDDLQHLVHDPIYSREEKGRVMAEICAKLELGALVSNIVGLMAIRHRLDLLPQLAARYRAMMAAHRGEITADVVSARQLSEEQAKALSAKIKEKMGQKVKLNVTVDKEIIGGLIVKVGSKMIDSSIRSKLTNLQNVMKEVG